jgi:hypothetical protein
MMRVSYLPKIVNIFTCILTLLFANLPPSEKGEASKASRDMVRKGTMNKLVRNLLSISLSTGVVFACAASSQAATVTVDPSQTWIGFMNVTDLPSNGGAYMFGSGWGTADLCATFSGPTLTLAPNTIGDPSAYWYTPAGGPGATGNKIMDAVMYVETATGLFTGQTLTFTGDVLANTLVGHVDANGNGWTSVAFVKDFAPDYSSSVMTTVPLVNGVFSVSLATINDPARHVQYGFETVGPDVWATDVAPYGNVQVTAVPEPSTLALIGLGLAGLMIVRRRK